MSIEIAIAIAIAIEIGIGIGIEIAIEIGIVRLIAKSVRVVASRANRIDRKVAIDAFLATAASCRVDFDPDSDFDFDFDTAEACLGAPTRPTPSRRY